MRRDIPQLVVRRAKAAGAVGTEWLANLDSLISSLEEQWRITVSTSLTGGSHAFAAYASGEDEKEYVLKIDMPESSGHADFSNAVQALKIANGRGYVRLFAYDTEKKAYLLERLGKPLKELNYSTYKQLDIICATLKKSWFQIQESHLPNGGETISWFRGFIKSTWISLSCPCPMNVIEKAYAFLESREADYNPDEYVLIHGDAHSTNILQYITGDSEFKLIDPDGVLYEKAYDLGVLMREWVDEYAQEPVQKGLERCERLHNITGVNKQAIWEWGFLQCVSTGLLLLKIGQEDDGKKLLKTVEAWVDV